MILIKKSLKLVLLCCTLFFLVHSVAAFTVGSVSISPPGNIYPGNTVNITSTVYAASGTAFPSYDDLQYITELDDPAWTYTVMVNGVKNTRPTVGGKTLTINGFELGYEDKDEVVVKVVLVGTLPATTPLGANKTLMKIQELDARGYSIGYSAVTIERLIGEPTPTPTPAYGSITVASVPAGANIYVDNVYKGLSPATFSGVPNGNHVILIKMDGYRDFTKSIAVSGDIQTVYASLSGITTTPAATYLPGQTPPAGSGSVTPTSAQTPGYGSLSVVTTPAGAIVYVDGTMMGVTPATIPMLSEGPHTITLIMDGYQDLSTTITVNEGTTSEYITGLSKTTKTPGFGPVIALASLGMFVLFRRSRD